MDKFLALILLLLLSPVIVILAVWIKLDSKGPIFIAKNVLQDMVEFLEYLSLER